MALEPQLHELVALAAGIWRWEVGLCLAVGRGDDFCWGVHTTFADAFITASYFMGVDWVNGGIIASLAIGGIFAVRPIKSIEECIEEVGCGNFLGLIDVIVGLVKSDSLRVNQSSAKSIMSVV